MITCPYCSSTNVPHRRGADPQGRPRYKCPDCGRKFRPGARLQARHGENLRVTTCAECGTETTNPKFCSRSCAAAFNNRLNPRKIASPKYCKHCGKPIHGRRTTCEDCNPNIVDFNTRTLGEIQRTAKYQVSARMRDIARRVYAKSNLPRACRNCGYDKHVEICHVRSISSFPDDTPVAVVNDLCNLVALCPNCHWEFDHGLLVL